nr:callose synthase 3 [Tanacetum cinerariifolium]
QILETHDKVAEKTQIYLPYNILPLDPDSANQAIMRYPEIQAAVKDNVANQREHLILLLANVHIRQIPKPDQQPKVGRGYSPLSCMSMP